MKNQIDIPPAPRKRISPPIGALLLALALPGGASAEDVTVEITGFPDDAGQVVVRLFSSSEAYAVDAADGLYTSAITARVARVRIPDLNGTHAIVAHHDRDADGSVRRLPLNIPLDPVGYSQGAWGGIARPDWVLAAFTSDIEPPHQRIELRTNALVAFAQMMAVGMPALLAVLGGLAMVRMARTVLTKSRTRKEPIHD